MEALDGNAIAAELFERFGHDMTASTGRCQHCGAEDVVAELIVYRSGPGTVARCPHCLGVAIVVVEIHGEVRVDASHFDL
jgi:uncharacterized Zn finger protein